MWSLMENLGQEPNGPEPGDISPNQKFNKLWTWQHEYGPQTIGNKDQCLEKASIALALHTVVQ